VSAGVDWLTDHPTVATIGAVAVCAATGGILCVAAGAVAAGATVLNAIKKIIVDNDIPGAIATLAENAVIGYGGLLVRALKEIAPAAVAVAHQVIYNAASWAAGLLDDFGGATGLSDAAKDVADWLKRQFRRPPPFCGSGGGRGGAW